MLLASGVSYSFGSNHFGQLGIGWNGDRFVPTRVQIQEPLSKIAVGNFHTLFLTFSGVVYAAGDHKVGKENIPCPHCTKVWYSRGDCRSRLPMNLLTETRKLS